VNHYGFIAVEDLNIKGLAGGMLAKSVQDAAWSSFLAKLFRFVASARLNQQHAHIRIGGQPSRDDGAGTTAATDDVIKLPA
jgi:hypothetical protein